MLNGAASVIMGKALSKIRNQTEQWREHNRNVELKQARLVAEATSKGFLGVSRSRELNLLTDFLRVGDSIKVGGRGAELGVVIA